MKKKIQKKEFVTENDSIMAAFAKVNLREAVAPIVRGKIVEDEDTYNKVQQLLDCPDMEHAHQFLLDVDFEDLTPEVKQQVDDLYQLAVSQGYIEGNSPENNVDAPSDSPETNEEQEQLTDASGGFENDTPDPNAAATKDSIGMNAPTMSSCAYTLFYSAMKNGEIKTGECYSNANTIENAKLDAVQKLQRLGFTAVDIIAAEECDPNAKGCQSAQPEEFGAPINAEQEVQPQETFGNEDAENDVEDFDDEEDISDDNGDEEVEDDDGDDDDEEVNEAEEETADNEKSEDNDSKGSDKDSDEKKELSRSEKLEFFKSYLEEFKAILQKMKAECYAEMALADRAKFYDEMNKVWAGKPDPTEFMTDDNVDQIEHMKIKISK